MAHKHSGGCKHVHTHSDAEPIDNHTCHCSVCKRVTGQPTTHVVFFKHGDLKVDNEKGLPATYHAFYDPATGVPKPNDGRPVYEGLRPEFVWPKGS